MSSTITVFCLLLLHLVSTDKLYLGDDDVGGQMKDELMHLQSVIPGVPGQDYPILPAIPLLDFSCEDKAMIKSIESYVVKTLIAGRGWNVC